MKRLVTLAAVLMCVCCVQAAAVFAHFMVSNSVNYSIATWKTDINLAQEAHLDAFALNIAYGDDSTTNYIDLAFQAAEATGFKLFLSFDYAGGVSAWPATEVSSIASRYTSSSSYYHYNGQPMISTFEGPVNADDWTALKKELGCFFIPDWSSLGAKAAADLGVADGLFSWDAWAWGDKSMNTYVDASYVDYLNGAPYMMPASPWFYTNLPGYNKNWLWRGDNAWYDRWVQIWWYKPEFVEIITWNDYGESHYIGPIYDNAMELFTTGKAPFNYATNMPHDGWRLFLPFVIDTYKFGTATITQEGVVGWYRLSEAKACSSHFTSGNTASQLQIEFEPYDIVEDAIFFTALLGSAADISVSVGGVALRASWTYEPFGSVGLYHGSVSFSGHTGIVIVSVTRGGVTVASFTGEAIGTQNCITGNTNFNAWVGSATSGATISATPPTPLSDMVCRNGTGSNNFAGLCENACEYGVYCPPTACVCLQLGPSLVSSALPKQTNPQGYPLAGEDSSYGGLCAYNCEIGFCPDTACGTVVAPLITPTVSDFSNPACQGGVGAGGDENLGGLCGFACPYGFCPAVACSCTASGGLPAQPPATPTVTGVPVLGVSEPTYSALCSYACEHGYCPGACTTAGEATPTGTGTGPGDTNSVVYIDPEIWNSADPTINCEPPCTFVLPPWTLSTTTTINIDPLTQTFEDTWPITSDGLIEYTTVTMVTVITFPAIVTTMIPVSNIIWDPVGGSSSVADIYSSFDVPGVTMTEGPGPNGQPGITYVYSYGPYPSPTSTSTTAGGVPPTGPPGHPSRVTITKGSPSPTCPFPDACHGHPCKGSHCTNGLHPLSLITLPCLGLGCNNNNNNNNNNNGKNPSPTPCLGNGCDNTSSSSSSTSTCATKTVTECYQVCTTTPCAKVCNTYAGCDCTTSTVTDYWVSCMSSTCTTTSSEVITGCYATATTTTVGESCPTLVSLDPSTDDQGDDATDLPLVGDIVTILYPESVIIGNTLYYVTSGIFSIGSIDYGVPSVSTPVTTLYSGRTGVIYPQATGPSLSLTVDWMTIIEMLPPPTTARTTAPKPTTTAVSQPSPTGVDSGVLQCEASSMPEMTAGDVDQAINDLCADARTSGAIFKDGGISIQAIQYTPPDNVYQNIGISATWIGGSNCPTLDFANNANTAVATCQKQLHDIVTYCPAPIQGTQHYTYGGIFTRDCIAWEITLAS